MLRKRRPCVFFFVASLALVATFDRNSVLADPLFGNPAKGDYRLKPE